jgi:hypothetical protein
MKFDVLRSIAHNIADSLASGVGLPIGVRFTDIFGEAGRSPEAFITVDFLAGTSSGSDPSPLLAKAISRYRDALADLCSKNGASPSHFRELTARYSGNFPNQRILVTVEDQHGHRSADEYLGLPAARPRVVDHLGRIRRK